MKYSPDLLRHPLKPRFDNFTPSSRTPWGGTKIAEMKFHLGIPAGMKIGESWEISGHPDFPNRFQIEQNRRTIEVPLNEISKGDPAAFYGIRNLERFGPQMPFLAKLLNAEQWLSVQVHPKPDYKGLKPGDHSKTEAWYILDAEKGAGIYLGLSKNATKEKMRHGLDTGDDVTELLHFVPVKKGEVYYVPAGTPHAIGPGILLYEPQETSATTYRYYDFGRIDAQGHPRTLHIKDAVEATDWEAPRGATLIKRLKSRPDGETLLSSPEFELKRISLEPGRSWTGMTNGVQGMTIIKGTVEIRVQGDRVNLSATRGESILIPAAVGGYSVTASQVTAPETAEALLLHIPGSEE